MQDNRISKSIAKPHLCEVLQLTHMKKFLSTLFFVLMFAFSFHEIHSICKPIEPSWQEGGSGIGTDFALRWNEAWCLREGFNPYDVWNNTIEHPRFYGNDKQYLRTATRNEEVNVYPPWEYTFMLPLTFVSRSTAWILWYCTMVMSFAFILGFSFMYGMHRTGKWYDGLFCAGAAIAISVPIEIELIAGNYPLPCAAALLAMAWCLNKKHDVVAGLCWAFLMVKPQQALLFAIPLLFAKCWKTIVTTAIVCLGASIPPVLMSGSSLLDLLLQPPKGSMFAFKGCPLAPESLSRWLHGSLGINYWYIMYFAMLIGVAICIWLTWRLRKCKDWIVLLVPATICSVCWTYCWCHGWCMCCLVTLALGVDIVQTRSFPWKCFCFVGILLSGQWGEFLHMYITLIPGLGRLQPLVGDAVHWFSLAALLLVSFWCYRIAKRQNSQEVS